MPKLKAARDDADQVGDPVFLILTPGVQASYDRKMRNCEAGWQANGDPWSLAEATTLTTLYRQPIPQWVDDGVWTLACMRRTKAHAKRAREASIRFRRYLAVRDAHFRDNLSWEQACVHAAAVWADNPDVAAPADRMWKSYKQVKDDLDEGRAGLYFYPKLQRRS
jgi:hypothetical protein